MIGRLRIAAALMAAVALGPAVSGLAAQPGPSNSGRPAARWIVTDDPFANVWFHSLALIGYDGYGPLPLYDRAYAARTRQAKQRAGLVTSLDRNSLDLRRRFERDSVLELVHFLPLYFVGQAPDLVLRSLRESLDAESHHSAATRAPAPASVVAGADAVAAAVPSPSARATLLSLIDAAYEEWHGVVRDGIAVTAVERQRRLVALQDSWDRQFAPSAALSTVAGVRRGIIVVSDALGPEGRTIRAPDGSAIIAVGRNGASSDPDAPLLSVVRELSFALVRAAGEPIGRGASRALNERTSDIAATRAGAMLLDAAAPTLSERYRNLFRSSAAQAGRSFESAFPLDSADESRLRRAVDAACAGSKRH